MRLSTNAHLRADDEIRIDVVEAHDHRDEPYLRIHLGGDLVVFPKDDAQAIAIAEGILAAIERKAQETRDAAEAKLAEVYARCTGARSVTCTTEQRNADGSLTTVSSGTFGQP